jgi:hypothetical protein
MARFRYLLLTCFLLQILALAHIEAAAAETRTALVIGNGAYSYARLANPVNDAEEVAKALRAAGFDVALKTDADRQSMAEAVRAFADKLKSKGGVGLFYFAGHGVQSSGENYLLAISGPVQGESDLKAKAVTAAEIVDAMAKARNGLNIVILDACRDNPISGGTRGLSRIDSNASLFVSYATSPGAVALDGDGRNSPFTKHLSQAISAANLSLEDTFKRTLKGVYQETRGQQTPWISSSFFGDFVFKPTGAQKSQPAVSATFPVNPQAGTQPSTPSISLTGVYRVSGTNPNGSRYRGMLTLAQNGDQFKLTWWISKQIFHGTGQFAGRMLVVNWGDKHPVIYSFGGRSVLDGEWADGSAKETLEPYSIAAPGAVTVAEGRYRVDGRNPNGSRYSGTVTIARNADRYQLSWQVGSTNYRGVGTLEKNLLKVDWGSATPVIYAVAADGKLTGLWDAGSGEETLSPAR